MTSEKTNSRLLKESLILKDFVNIEDFHRIEKNLMHKNVRNGDTNYQN